MSLISTLSVSSIPTDETGLRSKGRMMHRSYARVLGIIDVPGKPNATAFDRLSEDDKIRQILAALTSPAAASAPQPEAPAPAAPPPPPPEQVALPIEPQAEAAPLAEAPAKRGPGRPRTRKDPPPPPEQPLEVAPTALSVDLSPLETRMSALEALVGAVETNAAKAAANTSELYRVLCDIRSQNKMLLSMNKTILMAVAHSAARLADVNPEELIGDAVADRDSVDLSQLVDASGKA